MQPPVRTRCGSSSRTTAAPAGKRPRRSPWVAGLPSAWPGLSYPTATRCSTPSSAPAGMASGSGLLLFDTVNSTAVTESAPTGLTGWTLVDSATGSGFRTRLWQRSLAGGEAGRPVTVTVSQYAQVALQLLVYEGTRVSTPVKRASGASRRSCARPTRRRCWRTSLPAPWWSRTGRTSHPDDHMGGARRSERARQVRGNVKRPPVPPQHGCRLGDSGARWRANSHRRQRGLTRQYVDRRAGRIRWVTTTQVLGRTSLAAGRLSEASCRRRDARAFRSSRAERPRSPPQQSTAPGEVVEVEVLGADVRGAAAQRDVWLTGGGDGGVRS